MVVDRDVSEGGEGEGERARDEVLDRERETEIERNIPNDATAVDS